MHYIGMDYHKRYSYIVVKDKEGRVKQRGTVSNSREELQRFLEPYHRETAVLEAARNWGLISDWLEEVLDDMALAHPLKVRAIAEARIKGTSRRAMKRALQLCFHRSPFCATEATIACFVQ